MREFPELPALLTLTTLWSVFRTDVPRHIDRSAERPVPRTSTSTSRIEQLREWFDQPRGERAHHGSARRGAV